MPAVSVPAPVGGWNARDSLDAMPATDAIMLLNLIPRASYVESRRGTALQVTGLGGTVETLVPYRGTSTTALLAAANGNIWDATTAGAPSSLGSGFTQDKWQYTNHSNRVIMTNGADTPRIYNGALSAAVITGVTASTLWGCNTFKGRVFYWQQNAQSFWYAAAGAFQGALAQFDLSATIASGGTLVQMLTWTLDAGDGVDDLAVFLFSTGEALVYQGDDPADAVNWAKIGSFSIGEPISIRSHARVSNTEIIATKDGYLDLSQALKDGRYSENSAYSNKITRAAKDAALRYYSITGWQCILYPAGNLFIVNIPISTLQSIQHVRDTNSGSWCQFSNLNARCFAVHGDLLFFGTAGGEVYQADIGENDNGTAIPLQGIPAFSSLGSKAQRKQLTAVSFISDYAYPKFLAVDGLADFNTTVRSTVQSDAAITPGAWNTASWDAAYWGAAYASPQAQARAWRNLRAAGYSLTCSIRLDSTFQKITWFSTGYLFNTLGAV